MTNAELKAIIQDSHKKICNAYSTISEQSFNDVVKERKPWEKIPERGKLLTKSAADSFDDELYEARKTATDALKIWAEEQRAIRAIAPSAAAVTSINLFRGRKNATAEDARDLMAAYGDNYQAYKAIRDAAHEKKIYDLGGFKPSCASTEDVEDLERYIYRYFTPGEIEKASAGGWRQEAFASDIESRLG